MYSLWLGLCTYCVFPADNWAIKCIHATEDTGRVPRCVSITETNNTCSLSTINTGGNTVDWNNLSVFGGLYFLVFPFKNIYQI